MEAITPKQKLVFEFIHQFEADKGFAPSQNEIATHFGFKSLGTVQDYLNRLNKAGLILRPRYGTRAARAAKAEPTFDTGVKFQKSEHANNGDVVLVTIDGALAIKRVFKQRGRVELHPVSGQAGPPLINVDFTLHGVLTDVE